MRPHCYDGGVPRKADVEHQRAHIAHAVWRLAARGLERVSLREVAAEAGVSMGRVQHYFPTKDEMLLHGLQLAHQRMQARIEQRLAGMGDRAGNREVLHAVLDELLGEDPDTRQAIRVSVAYATRAVDDPRIAAILTDGDADILALAAEVIGQARDDGRARDDADPEQEARILFTLATGLGAEVALHGASVTRARTTLNYHLGRVLSAGTA